MTTIGGRDKRWASSGGVMGPPAPPGGGDKGGDLGVGTLRAQIPSRPTSFEGGCYCSS